MQQDVNVWEILKEGRLLQKLYVGGNITDLGC
jgi:hypothetical protein